jgi:hypothetical protein
VTILNALVAHEHALVVADTEAVTRHPATGEVMAGATTKLFGLPHLRALIAGRGHMLFITSVYTGALMSGAARVDELAAAMPAFLPAAHASVATELAGRRLEVPQFERQSILLVGWSPERQRMVGWYYEQTEAGGGFSADEVDEHMIAPWDAEIGPAPEPRQLAEMIETAKRQRAWLKRDPAVAAGGELIAAHVDRNGIVLRAVHKFAG